jgi:cytochrome c peroxidase
VRAAAIALILTTAACGPLARRAPFRERPVPPLAPPGHDEVYLGSDDNTPTPEKVALGARLFFDPIVSRDSSLACASCHQPQFAFGDTVPFSAGVGGHHAVRNTPPLVNRAYSRSFFWDGRTESLERTVLMPIENPNELGMTVPALVDRLRKNARYRGDFARAYSGQVVTSATIAAALASYVRMLRFGDAPVDRYAAGDSTALSPAARRGHALFFGKANCSACHAGPTFTDGQFHNTGVSYGGADSGRYSMTRNAEDRGRFRTATLREISRTAPYMHDGSIQTLEDVVAFYNRGGNPNPYLDAEIRPRNLGTDEQQDLVAFLHSLTSRAPAPRRAEVASRPSCVAPRCG